jgi:hypothetical protein
MMLYDDQPRDYVSRGVVAYPGDSDGMSLFFSLGGSRQPAASSQQQYRTPTATRKATAAAKLPA